MDNLDEENTELLIDVARRFYLQDQSKVDIGKEMGISRFRVARLLAEARDKKIVTITIAEGQRPHFELEQKLAERLKLKSVFIAASDADPRRERERLAKEAAKYLNTIVKPGQTIGLSWGRTLLPMAAYLENLPPVTIVQTTGIVGNDPSQSPIEIISRIRMKSDVQAKALIAPLFASSASSAKALRSEPNVENVLHLYKRLDIAISSIGSWASKVTQLGDSFEKKAKEELDKKGAVADFSGIFFDKNGQYVDSIVNERRISISSNELAKTPVVMAVAGGTAKTSAIHAVCQTGLATCLFTTRDVAEELLGLPAVTNPTWTRV